jgi:hypothetical protein
MLASVETNAPCRRHGRSIYSDRLFVIAERVVSSCYVPICILQIYKVVVVNITIVVIIFPQIAGLHGAVVCVPCLCLLKYMLGSRIHGEHDT